MIALQKKGVKFDLIHVDGGHDFTSALLDIWEAWKLLDKGGIMIVDDYSHEGVRNATYSLRDKLLAKADDFTMNLPNWWVGRKA
jgi:predicted O-methyltransferase YrrM